MATRSRATRCAAPCCAFDSAAVRLLQLRHVVDEKKFPEVVAHRGAGEVRSGRIVVAAGQGLLPSPRGLRPRADQALHQSSQRETDAVTSWKSVSGTPFATKRGAQWEIAASTRGVFFGFVLDHCGHVFRLQSKRIPPRRFAPPLLFEEGNHTGLSIPPHLRRGNSYRVSIPPHLRRVPAKPAGWSVTLPT